LKKTSTEVRKILPVLDSETDTDEEDVILNKNPSSKSKRESKSNLEPSSLSQNSNYLYRINEDSEVASKSPSKSTIGSSASTGPPQKSSSIFNKLKKRSKSPKKGEMIGKT
jgi:hypothetical protein